MVTPLCLSKLQAKFGEIEMKCVWFPSTSLQHGELSAFIHDIEAINSGPRRLDYGFFAKDITDVERQNFLSKTIWCIVYLRNKPIGFVYNYYLGELEGVSAIHLGLLKLRGGLGADFIPIPHFPIAFGNLMNFGPYYATNITHIPSMLENFGNLCNGVFPSPSGNDHHDLAKYKSVQELLSESYLEPVLGYDRATVDFEKSVVRGSMANTDQAFKTKWKVLPHASDDSWGTFIKERLTVAERDDGNLHVEDDMIQIGKIDFVSVGRPRAAQIFSALKMQQNFQFRRLADLEEQSISMVKSA